MNKQKGVINLTPILLILIAVGAFYFIFRPKTPDYSSRLKETAQLQKEDVITVPRDWPVYVNSQHKLSLKHPPEITPTIDIDNENMIAIVRKGPSQKEGTELYDGLSLKISSQKLPKGKTLKEVTQEAEQQSTENGTITQTLKSTTISQLTSYTYSARGLGEHKYIYLPQGETNYVLIIDSTVDPSNQGFDKTVNQILSSIKFTE